MVHYIDKPALLYATTYVLQLVVIHTSEAEQDALFGNSARVGGLKIGGHSSVYKGELISKCPFGVIVWTKIPTKFLPRFLL